MASSEAMETYAARLASFDKAHPTTKKRSSNAKGAKTLKWPHKTPTPVQLAKAGFFYQPTASSPDNATCFLCEKALDGWEEDDDPIKEHLNYSADCGWIVNVGIEQDIENGSFEENDPMSTRMLEARRSTFGGLWPHESKRGWTCKTQKMVEAGWYYCPTSESDDFVKCPYCSLSLDGWEPKDNPYHEHQRRSPDCAFFTLMQSLNPPRAKKGRPSKASRMSTQSDVTAENLSMIEVRIDEGNSALTTATHMTMNSAAPKANKKATKAKKGKGKAQIATRTMEPEEAVQMSSFVEPEDDDFAVKIDSPKVPKGKRGKKRTSEEMDAEEAHVNEPLESSPPPAKRRTTRNRSSTVKPPHMPGSSNIDGNDSDIHMTDAETMPPPSIPTSAKGGKGGRKRASSTFRKASNTSTASKASLRRAIPADAEIDAVLEVDLDRPLTDEEEEEGMNIDVVEKPKTRRLTRTRPGSRNISASIAPAKDKRTRKPSAAQEEVPEQTTLSDDQTQQDDVMTTTNETESDNIPAAEESKTRSSSDSPPMPKEPSSRKPSKSQYNREPSHQLSGRSNRASVLSVVPMPIEPATEKHESILVVEKTTRGRSNSVPSPVIPSPRAESDLPEHQPIENEIQQPHIEHIQDIETKIQTPEPTQPEQRAVVSFSTTSKQIVPSPTPSPQSSNAENAPPSSLPSQRRPPLTQLSPSKAQTIRIPLAASTPTTSPSKRKTASKLETTCAWMLADIEKTLMGSPGLNGNSSRLFDETNVVLTTPEKKMTVEEWILHNAKQAEERLRNECERLVGRFEGEGVRALKALEGIVCIE